MRITRVLPYIAALGAVCVSLGVRLTPLRTHTVRLEGNRFQPRQLVVHVGDTVRFVNGEGGPHNVEFDKDSIAPAVRKLIEPAMGGDKIGPLSSNLMILIGATFTFVVPELPAGRYAYLCSPHWGNMRGTLVVER